jgi:hypothetical protein
MFDPGFNIKTGGGLEGVWAWLLSGSGLGVYVFGLGMVLDLVG